MGNWKGVRKGNGRRCFLEDIMRWPRAGRAAIDGDIRSSSERDEQGVRIEMMILKLQCQKFYMKLGPAILDVRVTC